MTPIPVLYLDLDGTVRHGKDQLGRFVNTPDDVVIFPEALRQMYRAQGKGWRIVGITNQGGVALGHMTFAVAASTIKTTQILCAGLFDKIMMCVHHPDATTPEMAVCWCRKPKIGNVVEAAVRMGHEHPDEYYPPHLAMFVGDRPEDQVCAEMAGIRFQDAAEWRAEATVNG